MREKTQVLVVGAGPVGKGLAIELGQRGIECLVIEKNPRIGVAPRAKTTNRSGHLRTLDPFRDPARHLHQPRPHYIDVLRRPGR